MHAILATQRSNWNHLFHATITIAAVSAATAAAINGAEPALGLMVVATSLNLACAGFMYLVNLQQPSQLAEEQRRAARFFKRLVVEVEATLQLDPSLREEASLYWKEKVGTLHTLDKGFPLPLTPDGLEKFPKHVRPAVLSCRESQSGQEHANHEENHIPHGIGWSKPTEDYLKQLKKRLHTKDIPKLIKWAEKAKSVNLAMAKTSPKLAATAAVCCIAQAVPGIPHAVPWLPAALTVVALFTHSVSHALQLGSFFEVFRNHAGYYEDIVKAIERILQLPATAMGDWEIFLERINLMVGNRPSKRVLKPNDRPASKLF